MSTDNYVEVLQKETPIRHGAVLMRPSILTLVARLIGDFHSTSYNHALVQQVMHDAPPAYSHWLVLGPFQIGTRGGFASSDCAVGVLI